MAELTSAIKHHSAYVNGIRLRYAISGSGPAVVLIHGFPQTGRAWHQLMPALASRYTVIAPDMRGSGDSDKPGEGYDKRTIAKDINELVHQLGFDKARIVGHDMGMMVAYAYAAIYPDEVEQLVVMEASLPGLGLEVLFDNAAFPKLWHFGFFRAPGIAEALIAGRERVFFPYVMKELAYDPSALEDHDIEDYCQKLASPGGLQGGFGYYRALDVDAQHNKEFAKVKLQMPVLAIGGKHATGAEVGRVMEQVAENVQKVVIERAGHWVFEEQPEEVLALLTDFFNS